MNVDPETQYFPKRHYQIFYPKIEQYKQTFKKFKSSQNYESRLKTSNNILIHIYM